MKPYSLPISILTCFASAATTWACFSTPEEQIVPGKKLMERTKTIVLAKIEKAEVIGKKSISVRYHFREIKSLKGDAPTTFTIDGVSGAYDSPLRTFDHHSSDAFWEDSGGRAWHDTDCVIYPSFAVGGTFLVFLEKPYHRKSFELIIRTHGGEGVRDKWLSWVEEQTKTEQNAAEQPATRLQSKSK